MRDCKNSKFITKTVQTRKPTCSNLTLLTVITNMNMGKREYTFSYLDIIFIWTNMMKEYQKKGNISSIIVFQLLKVEMHCIH